MVMNMNLFNLVRDQFGSAAKDHLGGLLGRQPESLASSVDDSIGAVLDGFSTVAGDAGGREVLYEAVRYCDDAVVENPAKLFENRESRDVFVEGNNRLAGLVGVAKKDQMVEGLKSSAGLSQADAENMLGYVAPGVLGVLKRQIEQGAVLDNPDGIGQMFLGSGDPNSTVPAGHHVSGGTGAQSAGGGHAAAAVASEESDTSWLFRYVLPFLLLGGLVLAGMKNCGNMAGKKVIAAQESKMQLEIDGVRAEVDAAKSQVVTLQGEFDASKAQSAELTARADGLSGELDLAKANSVTLEGDLEAARAEFDAAQAEKAELAAKTDALNGELEVAKANIVTLEGDVESARADLEVARVQSADLDSQVKQVTAELQVARDLPTETSALQGLLSTVTSERDSSIDVSAQLQGDLDAALADRQAALDEGVRLQGELDASIAQVVANEEALAGLEATKAELEEMTAGRDEAVARNVEFKTSNSDLQGQLDIATPKIAELQRQLGSAANLRTEMQSKISSTTQALDEEKANRETDVNKLSATSTDLQAQLGAMLGMRDEAMGTLSLRDGEISSLGDRVVTLEGELVNLQDANAAAREEAALLEEKIAALNGELDTTKVSVDEARTELASTEESLSSVIADLETARTDVATVSAERDELLNKRDALASRIEELMAEKDAAIGESVQLNEQIAGLTTDLEAAKASDAASVDKLGLLSESFSGLQTELGLVTGARDEASTLAGQLRTEVSDLKGEVVRLEDDLATAQAAHDEAMTAMQAERDTTQSELDGVQTTLKSEIDSLEQQRDAALAKIEEADAQLVMLNTEKETAQATMDEMNAQAETLQAALQKEEGSVSELQASIATLEATKMSLTEERDGSNEQVTALSDEIAALQDSLQKEQAMVGGLNDSVAELESTKMSLTEERDGSNELVATLSEEIVALQESLQKEQEMVGGLNDSVAELEGTKMSLTEERDNSASEVARLSEELAAVQGSLQKELSMVGGLNATVAALESAKSKLTADQEEANDVIELLDSKVMENGKEIGALVDSKHALQKQIDKAAAMAQSEKDSTLAVRLSIEDRLNAAGLRDATVDAIEDDSAVAIVLGSGDLYGVGSASLSPQGNEILAAVGSIVSEYPDWRVDIEGHTDSQGIGSVLRQKYPTNWELSSARASAAVRYLNSRAGIDAEKLSARGFGETRPLDSNETAGGREKNRRVEVILRR